RRGHCVDGAQLDAGCVQRLLGDAVQGVQMLARRDLGNDAAGVLMRELRRDDVRDDVTAVVDDRDAGLVARRLDREDAHLPNLPLRGETRSGLVDSLLADEPLVAHATSYFSSSSERSFARRSRTERSRSRSVHMMIASSLLSL